MSQATHQTTAATPTKACRACGETKVFEDFHRDRKASDGRTNVCKPCGRESARQRYAKDAERQKQLARARYYQDHDRSLARAREYAEKNPERRAASAAATAKAARERNPEAWRARHAAWRAANPDKLLAIDRRRRARESAEHDGTKPSDVYAAYEGQCYLCGSFPTEQNRHIDHVRPLVWGGMNVAENMGPSCAPCNQAKARFSAEEHWARTGTENPGVFLGDPANLRRDDTWVRAVVAGLN